MTITICAKPITNAATGTHYCARSAGHLGSCIGTALEPQIGDSINNLGVLTQPTDSRKYQLARRIAHRPGLRPPTETGVKVGIEELKEQWAKEEEMTSNTQEQQWRVTIYRRDSETPVVYENVKHYWWEEKVRLVVAVIKDADTGEHFYWIWPADLISHVKVERER